MPLYFKGLNTMHLGLYCLYFFLFPHKMLTDKKVKKEERRIKDTLQPQKVSTYFALEHPGIEDHIYPIGNKDFKKLYKSHLISRKLYSRDPLEIEGIYSPLLFFIIITEVLLNTLLIVQVVINIINYSSDDLAHTALLFAISCALIVHNYMVIKRLYFNMEDGTLNNIIVSCQSITTVKAIVDTKTILNDWEYCTDEFEIVEILYALPKMAISGNDGTYYDAYRDIEKYVKKPYTFITYDDVISYLCYKYDTYSLSGILNYYAEKQNYIGSVPGLQHMTYIKELYYFHGNGHASINFSNKEDELYSELYHTIINKIVYYVDKYPQYTKDTYGYNKLRLLLTFASLRKADDIAIQLKESSDKKDVEEEMNKQEIDSTFDSLAYNEINSL